MKRRTKERVLGLALMGVDMVLNLYNENKEAGGEEMPVLNFDATMSTDIRNMLVDKFEYHNSQAEKLREYIEKIDNATEKPS